MTRVFETRVRQERREPPTTRASLLVPIEPPLPWPMVREGIESPSWPLDPTTQSIMERNFGHDLSRVRVHTDERAALSARAVNAAAFAVGRDLIFGARQYQPGTPAGRSLLAHELVHVLQREPHTSRNMLPTLPITSPGDASELEADRLAGQPGRREHPRVHEPNRIARAALRVGSLLIEINYHDVIFVAPGDYQTTIESRFAAWTGHPPVAIHSDLLTLSDHGREWVLFGLDLLIRNTIAAHAALDRVEAVRRLITRAPSSGTRALGTASTAFEREVLQVSGWFEVALAAPLTAPTGSVRAALTGEYNPPPDISAPPGGALDPVKLEADLVPALKTLLSVVDPAKWPVVGTESFGRVQTIADQIQDEARTFFSPYADVAMDSPDARGWAYSTNLSDVTAATPTQDQRIAYLLNRAESVGRREELGPSIFSTVNYESGRPADRAALLGIVTAMEADPSVSATVDRIIKHTGRTEHDESPPAVRVAISTEFNLAAQTQCQARWKTIRALCHELNHALVHPRFPATATTIGFGLIVREGFAEVLGVQLYRHVRGKAQADRAFKAQMEAGMFTACPAPPEVSLLYGEAAASAERIRSRVGNDNFRAAYFLGAVRLVGL